MDAGIGGFSPLPRNTCSCCNEQMYVVSIKRLLSGEGDWDITFCCESCDSEEKTAISPPAGVPQNAQQVFYA